ncbi:hypothetical protein [Pseudooceanicola sp.]|uniref:hypothetical protein n=1 Tax=Pseudooceanicola sp. TaxID=1914328 RepID=UPI00262B038B|nr:hypothetical protein [Pseudooceanicola sp.]MDF1855925.1 hypothetical protein [Pseudooceanicola sp.]
MANEYNLDFDGILEIALKGVRRSSVFMGLGVNAALDPSNSNYQLSHITRIQVIPDDAPQEALEHFKEEFKIWIEACALREATESFALFLDELHRACSVIHAVKGNGSMEEVSEKQSKFAKEGLPNKLNILEQRFGVTSAHSGNLSLINRARNCLTHRKGLVGLEDIRDQPKFTVAWRGLDLFVEEPDGTKSDLGEIPEGGLLLENGGFVGVEFVERSRTFDLGTMLSLSPRDLAEICWFLAKEAKTITNSAISYAQANGVVMNQVTQNKG